MRTIDTFFCPQLPPFVLGLIAALAFGCGKAPEPGGNSPAPSSTLLATVKSADSELGPTLWQRRHGFTSALKQVPFDRDPPAPEPGDGKHQIVKVKSSVGDLVAYVTRDPQDGRRHPAILNCHGGFGGIGLSDLGATARMEADGVVAMVPSWRGENNNPGQFELFWGEVDDALAAFEQLRALPYVDPDRVYVMGHSTGGTIAMLMATDNDKIRAAFSFEGAPNVARWLAGGGGTGYVPFSTFNTEELDLRSPANMVRSVRAPMWWFYGSGGFFQPDVERLQQAIRMTGNMRLKLVPVTGANHGTVFSNLLGWVTEVIRRDTDPKRPFPSSELPDVQQVFDAVAQRGVH